MKEIGSEFCQQYNAESTSHTCNKAYLLSGRTALRFIIDDICASQSVKKALMPSYCCESMVLPFLQAGIEVQFYYVGCDCIDYPYDNDADIILLVDFFGYTMRRNSEIAKRERLSGKVIIYDSTHKIDGNSDVQNFADYSFCSYRKWFYCNYAEVTKHKGALCGYEMLTPNNRYMELRDRSAKKKREYLDGLTKDKESFLSGFRQAEQMLETDYVGYEGLPVAFDFEKIVAQRRLNAQYLINELKKIPEILLWRDTVGTQDVPMFVPVLVNPDTRDDLRRALINESIYCPVHWPKSSFQGVNSDLYDRELSLVCDQRYDTADMERIVRAVKNFFGR